MTTHRPETNEEFSERITARAAADKAVALADGLERAHTRLARAAAEQAQELADDAMAKAVAAEAAVDWTGCRPTWSRQGFQTAQNARLAVAAAALDAHAAQRLADLAEERELATAKAELAAAISVMDELEGRTAAREARAAIARIEARADDGEAVASFDSRPR